MQLVNLQAPIAHPFYAGVAAYLAERLACEVTFDPSCDWRAQAAAFLRGEVALGVICGLPYVRHAEHLTPLAAPVMAAARYGDRPVYFSDVVVAAGSPYRAWPDLRGARWCYNEAGSHSGVGVVRYTWAQRGLGVADWAAVVPSGSHQTSLDWIRTGRADVSAIDSTVLELTLAAHPEWVSAFRVLESWGPSPMPPIAASRSLPEAQRQAVRAALTTMHEDPAGRAVLERGLCARFAPVDDADYNPIRQMAAIADRGAWTPDEPAW